MPFEQRSAMGLYTSAERQAALDNGGEYAPISPLSGASSDTPKAVAAAVAPAAVKSDVKIEAAPVATPVAAAPAQTIGSSSDLLESMGIKSDAPLCMTCGVKMRMSGACFVCEGCGNTSGCS
jgi:ribonucleoside-diphosphate reductase alpha chain